VDLVPDGTTFKLDNWPVDPAVLDAAAELEARDAELAASLDAVDDLARRAAHVHERALALEGFLAGVPLQLAALEREHAQAVDRRSQAERALAEAERTADELGRARRVNEEKLAQAERELAHAREAAADAARRVERVAGQQQRLLEEERAARAEISLLAAEAGETAAAVREQQRVSESGRSEPGETLSELAAWADRVGAALLVVRGSLATERERLLREAGELAASALGEPVYGSNVSLLRRRLEDASTD
jgi:chromosome segregation ATPase